MSNYGDTFVATLTVSGALTTGAKTSAGSQFVLPFPADLVSITGALGANTGTGASTVNVTKNGTSVTGTNVNPDGPLTFAQAATAITGAPVVKDTGVTASAAGADQNFVTSGVNIISPVTPSDSPAITSGATGDVFGVNIATLAATPAPSDLTLVLTFVKK